MATDGRHQEVTQRQIPNPPTRYFGKRLCFTFDTKHEAAEKKREIESAVSKNKYVPPAEVPTVKDAATDWLNGAKVAPSKHGGFIKESTIEAWANHINRYIVRTLGPVKMDRVD